MLKRIAIALAACFVLASGVGVASANRLSFSNANFRIVWPATSAMLFEEPSGIFSMACSVTFEGSFHRRTFGKVRGELIGHISRAVVGELGCSMGSTAHALEVTLPWHVRYQSFAGVLPAVASVRIDIVGASFLINVIEAVRCLYRSSAASPLVGDLTRAAGGAITGFTLVPEATFPLVNEALSMFVCPEVLGLIGRGTVTLLGNANTISITLI